MGGNRGKGGTEEGLGGKFGVSEGGGGWGVDGEKRGVGGWGWGEIRGNWGSGVEFGVKYGGK